MMKELSFADIKLRICAVSAFAADADTAHSEQEKNQYHYRLMLVQKGEADLFCLDTKTHLKANSIVLFPPNCPYRMVAKGQDLTLLSVWFAFDEDTSSMPYEVVRQSDFDPTKITHRYAFSDAPAFNRAFLWMPSAYSAKAFLRIYQECSTPCDAYAKRQSQLHLWLFLSDTVRTLLSQKEKSDALQVEQILSYIHEHICEKMDCADIAAQFSCHPNHLNRLVKQKTGESAKQYLLREKMRYARRLLVESELSGTEVAARLGFFDYSHFAKCYKKYQD